MEMALHAFGTAWMFEKRARKYAWRLRALAFLGLVVPLTVGALVGAFGPTFAALKPVLVVAGLVATAQFVFSLWAVVAKWDDALAGSWEGQIENNRLFKRLREISELPASVAAAALDERLQVVAAEYDAREAQDVRREFSEAERREGMRAGLRQFRRPCAGCAKVPTDMKATACGVCGNF